MPFGGGVPGLFGVEPDARSGHSELSGMLKIESRQEPAGAVRLALTGRMNANSIGELRRAIDRARRHRPHVALDLSEITLIDRASLDFLAELTKGEIELMNCPAYLTPWISRSLNTSH